MQETKWTKWRPIVGDSDAVDREITEGWIQTMLNPLLAEFSADGDEAADIHVLGAMEILASSWVKVSSRTIFNCFANAGWKRPEEDSFNSEVEPDSVEFVGIDDDVATTGYLSEADILQIVRDEPTQPESEDEESFEQNCHSNNSYSSNDSTGGLIIELENF